MLLEFTVGNFRSFKEPKTFSMAASSITELANNVYIKNFKLKLLKTVAIYGANASGKSNLIKAMGFMKEFVIDSSKESQQGEKIYTDRFRLSTETDDKPSFFEMLFVQNDIRYRYGFEVDEEKVHSEWLFSADYKKLRTVESTLFTREFDEININEEKFKEGKLIKKEKRTRNNSLFLSVNAQFNGEISSVVTNWFLNHFHPIHPDIAPTFSFKMLKDINFKKTMIELLKFADPTILDVIPKQSEIDIKSLPIELQHKIDPKKVTKVIEHHLTSLHSKYDENQEKIIDEEFDFNENESDGTKKLFSFSAPIKDTLKQGNVLIIDELNRSLHPNLCKMIVEMFNSKETNPFGAQLIFTTHDVTLLKNDVFRRDQIWFTEKDKLGASDLFSLVEFKVRKDASFDKDYIIGKYGAIPFLGTPATIFGEENDPGSK